MKWIVKLENEINLEWKALNKKLTPLSDERDELVDKLYNQLLGTDLPSNILIESSPECWAHGDAWKENLQKILSGKQVIYLSPYIEERPYAAKLVKDLSDPGAELHILNELRIYPHSEELLKYVAPQLTLPQVLLIGFCKGCNTEEFNNAWNLAFTLSKSRIVRCMIDITLVSTVRAD